jgi:hypothetical protein
MRELYHQNWGNWKKQEGIHQKTWVDNGKIVKDYEFYPANYAKCDWVLSFREKDEKTTEIGDFLGLFSVKQRKIAPCPREKNAVY